LLPFGKIYGHFAKFVVLWCILQRKIWQPKRGGLFWPTTTKTESFNFDEFDFPGDEGHFAAAPAKAAAGNDAIKVHFLECENGRFQIETKASTNLK
jgi:hypothetical protein